MRLRDLYPDAKGRTYVLVHGAWVGEFCFDPLIPILEGAGATVFNVSLRGQGKRRAEHKPTIRLTDHIDDVVSVIEANDLTNIHLVGHSYGGKVITGVWDRMRDRVAHACFLDGFAPVYEGENVFGPDRFVDQARDASGAVSNEVLIPFPKPELPVARLAVPMPAGTIGAGYRLKQPLPEETPKTYVLAGRSDIDQFREDYFTRIENDPTWEVYVLPTGHNIMQEIPTVLASILLDAKA